MGQLDINQLLIISPDEMTDQEKEDLYHEVVWFDSVKDIELDHVLHVFRITQHILKFKGEQVESLIAELDNLAACQGEEEAHRTQALADEVEELRSQLLRIQSSSDRTTFSSNLDTDDSIRREIVKIQITNDQLNADLQEKEQELIMEKKELEKLTGRITKLEEENKTLKGELLATEQELSSHIGSKTQHDSPDPPTVEKYHNLTELLRQKNKHISQLLMDIEDLEKENTILKEKLSIVQEEMIEGTEHMSQLSAERINLGTCVQELKDKASTLEQENAGLRNQISELIAEKEAHNKQLEDLSAALDIRVKQWKEVLQKKDAEIGILRSQIHNVPNNISDDRQTSEFNNLSQTLMKREQQIEELKEQLKQATVDLNESASLLEQQKIRYKSKFGKNLESSAIKQFKKKLEQAENRITVLESKCKHAEDDALKKAEEVTELILQLREYESGIYGLEDAMVRIKELQKQKDVRDKHIEQLIQAGNQLQDEAKQLEQENLALREKLGISAEAEIKIEGVLPRHSENQIKISQLTAELDKRYEEIVVLKLENRKLQKRISLLQQDSSTDDKIDSKEDATTNSAEKQTTRPAIELQSSIEYSLLSENVYLEEKLKELIDENEGLRKGMHEILDSIRDQDGTSDVQIASECLERLLEALDSRHVNGWYQPAMRLQAQIQTMNGINTTLREELHTYRQKEIESAGEVQILMQRIKQLEACLKQEDPGSTHLFREDNKSFNAEKSVILEMNESARLELDKKLGEEQNKRHKLESDVTNFQRRITEMEEQMREINNQYDNDKESWQNVKAAMEREIKQLRDNETDNQSKITEYEKYLDVLKHGPDAVEKLLSDSVLRLSALKTELEQTARKYKALLETENKTRQERDKLSEEMFNLIQSKDQEIISLRKENNRFSVEIKKQLTLLENSVDSSTYQNLSNDFNQLTLKYRDWLNRMLLLKSEKENLVARLENELALIYKQKKEIETRLKCAFEELTCLKSSTDIAPIPDQVALLTKKLASLEVGTVNNKQHSDHLGRMCDLTKEQLKEAEHRCKLLEERLEESLKINVEMQKTEMELRDKVMHIVDMGELGKAKEKLHECEQNVLLLSNQKRELQDIANIAQEQVRSLETHRKFYDLQYDSLQRRILELQSVSDEKMIIDRLTQELALFQRKELMSDGNISSLEIKIVHLESDLAQSGIDIEKLETDYNQLRQRTETKIKLLLSIIYELQKRFIGSLPLVTEELWCEDISRAKEEYNFIVSSLTKSYDDSAMKELGPSDSLPVQSLTSPRAATPGSINNTQQKLQELNMWMVNKGLENKIQIYEERLERQEKLISRLEQEIIHADTQCQEFLLHWNVTIDFDTKLEFEKDTKHTQTIEGLRSISVNKVSSKGSVDYDDIPNDFDEKLNQARLTIRELNGKVTQLEEDKLKMENKLIDVNSELKEKEYAVLLKDKQIAELRNQSVDYFNPNHAEESTSVERLALKTTVESLQNIIDQKEDTIKRYQNLLKESREEHAQNIAALQKDLKVLQETVDNKDQEYNRVKIKLESIEKGENRRITIDTQLTKIHELEDELSQSTNRINQLSSQLALRNQQAEQLNLTTHERLKEETLQDMRRELGTPKYVPFVTSDSKPIAALNANLKEKSEEIERLNQTVEELKKRLGSGEKLPAYRDRLKTELERYKRRVEIMIEKEKEYKAEIQKLKNQIITRPTSGRRKEALVTSKEEQLVKKLRMLEEQIGELTQREEKWKENRKAKCDEEVGKWQTRKRYQQSIDKLQQKLKECTSQIEALRLNNERLRETIIRMEKEKIFLENRLKMSKVQSPNCSLIEELQKANSRLEDELRVLRRSIELTAGTSSLTDVIEAQERKINALKISQRGDGALAEEVEKLHERKSQLQKSNLRLEEENLQLKLQLDQLHTVIRNQTDKTNLSKVDAINIEPKSLSGQMEQHYQLKGEKRRTCDLERAVIVLKRVIEKLQAENKQLHTNKVSQLQDKNYVEKLLLDMQKLQENYIDAIEKCSFLENELQQAREKIDSLQNLVTRSQNEEEVSNLKSQLFKKTQLLGKVKVLLEKTASREKELNEKDIKNRYLQPYLEEVRNECAEHSDLLGSIIN